MMELYDLLRGLREQAHLSLAKGTFRINYSPTLTALIMSPMSKAAPEPLDLSKSALARTLNLPRRATLVPSCTL